MILAVFADVNGHWTNKSLNPKLLSKSDTSGPTTADQSYERDSAQTVGKIEQLSIYSIWTMKNANMCTCNGIQLIQCVPYDGTLQIVTHTFKKKAGMGLKKMLYVYI